MDIIIKPEFRDLIPPLSEAELEQLHKSLDARGCIDPLLVWRKENILLDGHNRHAYCVANSIPFDVKEIHCSTEDTARNFIILHQLGRRNVPPATASMLRGMLYLGRKKEHGVRGPEKMAQSEPSSTAQEVAKETGVSPATVKRDAKFAAAAEKLGVTQDIISGKDKRSKAEIVNAAEPKKAKPGPKQSNAWKGVVRAFSKLSVPDMKKAIDEIDKIWNEQ